MIKMGHQQSHTFHSDEAFMAYSREKSFIWGTVFLYGFLVPYIIAYLVINPVGTYYYTKLPSTTTTEKGVKGGALATVILGWLGFAPLNLYSPSAYVALN